MAININSEIRINGGNYDKIIEDIMMTLSNKCFPCFQLQHSPVSYILQSHTQVANERLMLHTDKVQLSTHERKVA